jgi:hypothetical protein
MSDERTPATPAGLASILAEEGWREDGKGFILDRHPSAGRATVSVCEVDGKWWAALVTCDVTVMTLDEVDAFANILRRIEAALAVGDGGEGGA